MLSKGNVNETPRLLSYSQFVTRGEEQCQAPGSATHRRMAGQYTVEFAHSRSSMCSALRRFALRAYYMCARLAMLSKTFFHGLCKTWFTSGC